MEKHITRSLSIGILVGVAGGGLTAVGASLGLCSLGAIWPVFSACAILGALVNNVKQSITGQLDNRMRTHSNRLDRIRRDTGDIHGLVRLAPFTRDLPLPMGGGWALTGDSAALLAREALIRKPTSILELGSGASTLILGQILKINGRGRLLSVDHDPIWANETRRYIKHLGLDDVVTVVDAPLKSHALKDQMVEWYGIPGSSIDALGAIDFLLVDGPPQEKTNSMQARYPAFPVLREKLSPHAIIFVDDAKRSSEKKMVERWMAEEAGWHANWFDTVDGVCLLTRDQ